MQKNAQNINMIKAEISYSEKMKSKAIAQNWDFDAEEWSLKIKELKKCLEELEKY